MTWTCVQLDSAVPIPWRNGGGLTRELALWPDPGDWLWRMSVAEVDASGPFSAFPGVTRWFAVLHGAGVRLQIDGKDRILRREDAPATFDGNAVTHCSLLDGPTQDFNLMVRTTHGGSSMRRVNGQLDVTLHTAKTVAVYAIDSSKILQSGDEVMVLEAGTLAWQTLPAHAAVHVQSINALWMEIAS